MKEAIRRKLGQHEWWIEMMLDGFEEVKGKGKGFPWNERGFYELARRDFSPAVRGRLERLRREEAEARRKVEEERVGGGDGDGEVECGKDDGEKGDGRGDERGDEKGDDNFSIDPSELD